MPRTDTREAVAKVVPEDHDPSVSGDPRPLPPEQQYRAAAWGMLAALLRDAPSVELLSRVEGFADIAEGGDEMALSMSMLGLAAQRCREDSVAVEYHDLFIGLGRGELVPYGSWYLTGFLMEKSLGDLRADLERLGFTRESGVHEPEDHISALCEVMAMLIQEGGDSCRQRAFFSSHLAPWGQRFFSDLAGARGAVFYRAVARFGAAFTELEMQYLGAET